jgi:hypothetical protein
VLSAAGLNLDSTEITASMSAGSTSNRLPIKWALATMSVAAAAEMR